MARTLKLPVLEFKKINPTKYRVMVHGASDIFPLVFSESFQGGWKAYLADLEAEAYRVNKKAINNYKIWDENSREQANRKELGEYINSGWITRLGGDNIKFISRNFGGTIQNDNLPNGSFRETWFKNPIVGEDNHILTNIYANSWVINPTQICQGSNQCIRNSDGSYDLELVVEYWPQRVFYLGMVVSGVTLMGCLVAYLMTLRVISKKKKRKKL